MAVVALAATPPARAETFVAGGFSFSDELGGFRLLSASGSGTSGDPIVLTEEIAEIGPAILTIRRLDLRPQPGTREPWAALTLVKIVANRSGQIWAGYDLELQEELDMPSVYGDGLSFDQIGKAEESVASDTFSTNRRRFEPYDRISFERGHVNPDGTVRFTVRITDPTPVATFYLLQDPRLLYAGREAPRAASLARRQ